jgi:MAF protein
MTFRSNSEASGSIPASAPLILASSSSYRRAQLAQLGLKHTCQPADINETPLTGEPAEKLALRLAEGKARAIAKTTNAASLIIGCDQTASCGNTLLGKPLTEAVAIKQLSTCSGTTVTFNSALCVINNYSGEALLDNIVTRVQFRLLSEKDITTYIKKEQPLDCAGSFKCEGLGIALFDTIHSDDPSALIGLPLIALTRMLRQFGVDAIQQSQPL